MRACDIENRQVMMSTLNDEKIKGYLYREYGVETISIPRNNELRIHFKSVRRNSEPYTAAKQVKGLFKPLGNVWESIKSNLYGTELVVVFNKRNSEEISSNLNKLKGGKERWIQRRDLDEDAKLEAYEALEEFRSKNIPDALMSLRQGNQYFANGEVFPTYEDAMNELERGEELNTQNEINYQIPSNRNVEEFIASEKTIRDLTARMSNFDLFQNVDNSSPFEKLTYSEQQKLTKKIKEISEKQGNRIGIRNYDVYNSLIENNKHKEAKEYKKNSLYLYKIINNKDEKYKGVTRVSDGIIYINLAYATLDTPIHEILAHPIIRAIKNRRTDEGGYVEQYNNAMEEFYGNNPNATREQAIEYADKKVGATPTDLYQNLLKELEYGKGKEVLDRIKRDYNKKSTDVYKIVLDKLEKNGKVIEEAGKGVSAIEKYMSNIQGADRLSIGTWNVDIKYTLEEQQEEAIVELLGLMTAEKLDKVKDGKLISLLKRLLKEMKAFMKQLLGQKEVEIDKLPDNMTLGDIADLLAYSNSKLILPGNEVVYTTPDNQQFKTYQEASNHISDLAKSVEDVDLSNVDLFNLPNKFETRDNFIFEKIDGKWFLDFTTINTLYNTSNSIHQSYKKINKIFITEKDYKNAQENGVIINDALKKKYLYNGEIYEFVEGFDFFNTNDEYIKYPKQLEFTNDEIKKIYFKENIKDNYVNDDGDFGTGLSYTRKNTIQNFIEKNKEYEQSKEIIEEWKKVNNIQYNPEEVYSRGQEFVSVVGAYSDFDVNLMMQNLLQHIEDNQKAGVQFAISAFTKPVDRKIGHLEGGGGKIKFKIYPKSEDILWAADQDVYSGSITDASEKINNNKQKELLGVSYTKYPTIHGSKGRGIEETIRPNLAEIIENIQDHHNELGISLTGSNFRLEYDEDIPYTTKKIIDSINSILDQKYGKLVKPEIKKQQNQRQDLLNKLDYLKDKEADLFATTDFDSIDDNEAERLRNEIEKVQNQLNNLKSNVGIQPTQTNETLKESIKSVKSKLDSSKGDFLDILTTEEVVGFENENGYLIVDYSDNILPESLSKKVFKTFEEAKKELEEFTGNIPKKEYTEQALINTKIAALKEVAKKYPRSLIRSEVRSINSSSNLGFAENELPFQKVSDNSFQQFQQSLNKPNTNPILQGNEQEQVKKFGELQERLNNKEFLEGAKNAFESSEELQNVYYEAAGFKIDKKGLIELIHYSRNNQNPLDKFQEDFPLYTSRGENSEYKDYGKQFNYVVKKEANIKELLDFHGKYGIDLDKHDEASKGLQPYHFNLQEIQAIRKEGVDILIDDWGEYIILNPNSVVLKKQQKQEALNAYTDYIARVSLGIIKNPSSGEYNYESQVKDIVYHHSSQKLEKFDKSFLGKETGAADTQLGFFFAEDKSDIPKMVIEKNKQLENIGESKRLNFSVQNNVLLNIKNPEFYYGFIEEAISNVLGRETRVTSVTAKQDYKEARLKLENNNKDSLIYGLTIEPDGEGGTDVNKGYVVFEPEQIHILSSKADIQGFKSWVDSNNQTSPKTFSPNYLFTKDWNIKVPEVILETNDSNSDFNLSCIKK